MGQIVTPSEKSEISERIPERFIRVWVGPEQRDPRFDLWWGRFAELHPGWDMVTVGEESVDSMLPVGARLVYDDCKTWAGKSNVLRAAALYWYGGVYVDTDMMPLRPFHALLEDPTPFAGLRSSKSIEMAVIGAPARHPAIQALLTELPAWYWSRPEEESDVHNKTGPLYYNHVLYDRDDVRKLPVNTFYPVKGFAGPRKAERDEMFRDPENFPRESLAAHYSSKKWGRVK